MDLTCAFELFLFKTVVFKFKWKPCFNTNDFIKLSKDLALVTVKFTKTYRKKGVSNQGAKIESDLHKTIK